MTELYAPGTIAGKTADLSRTDVLSKTSASDRNSLSTPPAPSESLVKQDWKAQKEEQARIRKRQNDLKKPRMKFIALKLAIRNLVNFFNEKRSIPT